MAGRSLDVSPDLRRGYQLMARDEVNEREALEWAEALIGDALAADEPETWDEGTSE